MGRWRSRINFRPAKESDLSQIVDLTNLQYARKKKESYFLWQYFNSPYPSILMCAFEGSQVIGTFGLQKRELTNGACVGQATDLLVAPGWRRKGIFRELGKRAISNFRDVDILCSFTNSNGRMACEKAFNWKTVGKINLMRLSVKGGIHLKPLKKFSNDIKLNRFVEFFYSEGIRLWRYDKHPDYEYNYVKLDNERFAVTKLFKDPISGVLYGDIVDFECEFKERMLLKELFLKASISLQKRGVEFVTTWALPHTPLREIVELLGFIEVPQERYFCMQILNPKYEALYNISRWHLIQADSEIY